MIKICIISKDIHMYNKKVNLVYDKNLIFFLVFSIFMCVIHLYCISNDRCKYFCVSFDVLLLIFSVIYFTHLSLHKYLSCVFNIFRMLSPRKNT